MRKKTLYTIKDLENFSDALADFVQRCKCACGDKTSIGGVEMNLEKQFGDESGINWMPKWVIKSGVGLTIDDGCYIILIRKAGGQWSPTKWIPKEAIDFINGLKSQNR